MSTTSHLTEIEMLAFVKETLDDTKFMKSCEHLTICEQCAESIHALRSLQTNFDNVWKSWTARSHGETYWANQVETALAEIAQTADAPIKERILKWIQSVQLKAEAAFNISVNRVQKAVQVVKNEHLTKPDSIFPFWDSQLATVTAFSDSTTQKTPDYREKIRVRLESSKHTWANLSVDASAGKISLMIPLQNEPWPLIFLMRGSEMGLATTMGKLTRPEESDFLLVEFENVIDGNYTLLIEPFDTE